MLADRLGRALVVGGTASLGFLVVFGITGSLITAGVRSFIDYMPWVALVIGAALAMLGVALLSGRELRIALPKPQAGTQSRQLRSMLASTAAWPSRGRDRHPRSTSAAEPTRPRADRNHPA